MSHRRYVIAPADAGQPLGRWLQRVLALSWPQVQELVQQRGIWLQGRLCIDLNHRLQRGQHVEVRVPMPKRERARPQTAVADPRPTRLPSTVIRHVDEHILVAEKPAGLTTMRHPGEAAEFGERGRRYLPPTFADLLPSALATYLNRKPGPIRAVHRLDKETSGLLVFARTVEAERHLGQQFRAHTVDRTYLALVRGKAQSGRIESSLLADRGDGRRGSGAPPGEGQLAITHVSVVEDLGDFTLVECRLETGRTHQVRIHLGEAGTPLCGERLYDRPLHGRPVPDRSGAKRVALHAATLALDHPTTGERLSWQSPLPRDLAQLLQQLRERRRNEKTRS